MYNHSSIWKNITMIIFYIFIIFIIVFIFIKQKLHLEFYIAGLKSELNIKFWFFKFKRYGNLTLMSKNKLKLEDIKKFKSDAEKISMGIKKAKKTKKKKKFEYMICLLKNVTFERVKIYEKFGLLVPDKTALFLPVLSNITMLPLHFLKIKFLDYKVVPAYNELKFNAKIDAKINFRIINLIFCIIKEFWSKLLYSNKFTRRKRYE